MMYVQSLTLEVTVRDKSLELQVVDTHWVPQRHLSLAHATEAGTEDLPIRHEHRPDRPGALMRLLLLL